ncbi:MAG: PEP-CTERM sorting domain-containing protein [Phycisphaeraceae bacterium]|nr:PEP-CTERM sorting domain-containing protein [Phycisphaeraceae bacterium]
MTRFNALALTPALVLSAASVSAATVTLDTMLFQPVPPATEVVPPNERTNFTGDIGILFATDTAQTVTHLGFWDKDGDGLVNDHTITLSFSNDNGASIASTVATATITAAESLSAELVGGYRWVELDTAVILNPQTPGAAPGDREWYILSATAVADGDPFGNNNTQGNGYVLNDDIRGAGANSAASGYFDARFNGANTFGGAAFNTYVAGNLAVIPEPGSLALLGLGGLLIARRRRG